MEWTPRHRMTARTESLVRRLVELAREIDEDFLDVASTEARWEWKVFCGTWPNVVDLRSGVVSRSDDELDAMIGKVLRFKAILAGTNPNVCFVPHVAAA